MRRNRRSRGRDRSMVEAIRRFFEIFFSIRENGLCFLISSPSTLWLRTEMAVELRIGLLSFRNYELGNSRSLLARALIARNRTRHGRTRRNLVLSTLPTSLPSRELVGDEVMQMFLKERQLNGDYVSRAFDMLRRRNELKFDGHETGATEETTSEMYDNEDISGGYLRLAATRDWISGSSDAPINKKLTVKDWQDESDKRKKLNLLKYEALKGELLFLTVGIGAVCSVYRAQLVACIVVTFSNLAEELEEKNCIVLCRICLSFKFIII